MKTLKKLFLLPLGLMIANPSIASVDFIPVEQFNQAPLSQKVEILSEIAKYLSKLRLLPHYENISHNHSFLKSNGVISTSLDDYEIFSTYKSANLKSISEKTLCTQYMNFRKDFLYSLGFTAYLFWEVDNVLAILSISGSGISDRGDVHFRSAIERWMKDGDRLESIAPLIFSQWGKDPDELSRGSEPDQSQPTSTSVLTSENAPTWAPHSEDGKES